ncbi:hypothetical protein FSP39_004091 [Pinctada imbricata]|uniref:Guanine nucleotide-binding protein G(s) subunit alpha n=1 Tax=Pinctada imbricata TaxID=66713 RepID=A0AA88YS05_PINIB|nr:hypothetical protein FSP39_004091 [Pinctada imbricata]
MQGNILACFGRTYDSVSSFTSMEEAKLAKLRNKQITRLLKEHRRNELKRLKILLLGTGESGKSTITKQMKIIHVNGFDLRERLEKIYDIKKNIKESIIILLVAMKQLGIPLDNEDLIHSRDFIMQNAAIDDIHTSDEFLDHAQRLWTDQGVQQCYTRSHEHEFQLIDCAKYFLDKLPEVRDSAYVPSDQDILRCRSLTTSIQHIEFEVPEGGNQVKFNVYDVGGQQGERKKWIQVFDSVTAILFVADCSSFDQTLREDPEKNRLLEALENFEQVWNNRFLKYVSVMLFLNKIDVLAEKIVKAETSGILPRSTRMYFPTSIRLFPQVEEEIDEFLRSYPRMKDESKEGKTKSRKTSRPYVDPEVIKTAIYIKRQFMRIVQGTLVLKQRITAREKSWHEDHFCDYFYTCAIDTNNVQRVMNGCRTILIKNHLKRYGIM